MSKGLHVLLIDDEEDFCTTLARRLELRGMVVQAVFTGQEGLDVLAKSTPHVVLLDMRMPGLSGVEVLTIIREQYSDLPVIVITGHCSEPERDKAEGLRVHGYLDKPIVFDELLQLLNNFST